MTQVSIGIPVYNGEKYLARALDSLLAQSFKDFEIVISDNASTDRTAEICRSYQNKDARVRYFRSDQKSWERHGIITACSSFPPPLFSSGLPAMISIDPLFLERCVDALHNDPGVVLSHTYVR